MAEVSDEADLDALIAKIQSDLRSGRHPADQPPRDRDAQLRSALREIRGKPIGREAFLHALAQWLVPGLIILAVGAAVLLTGGK